MSIQDAKAFFNAVLTNDNFRSQLQSSKTNEERAVAIRAAGYSFTPEESQQLLNQIIEAAAIDSGLSEAELEAVAGGAVGAVSTAGPGAIPGGLIGAGAGAIGGVVSGVIKGGDGGEILGDAIGGAVSGGVGGAQGPA
ncbi:Nif11-like leader peptide family natural product precursor [Nostoc sp. DedQUE09]|uniref:Nif11-like leader peptide family natural product precursor n=1 Tax=Nostoc sp. DedQUE09 TaxID=3075394 RepID=UPI002AD2B4E9|nr:Nif11-like leader peptide family natural product precursor [Nostoc sp. DedQUE09]MDZ7952366.1 Nif11-like leader peptide family natural product precursor [Nostoc sp. DedQUE09]